MFVDEMLGISSDLQKSEAEKNNIETHNTNVRKALLLSMKDCAHKLMPYVHEASDYTKLSEKNAETVRLCSAIEKCIFHGIRISEFYGTMPFWGLLQRTTLSKSVNQKFIEGLEQVSQLSNLRTPIAKARAWIRYMLNKGLLEESLRYILSHSRLLPFFYHSNSIMFNVDDSKILLAIAVSIKILPFSIAIDNDDLNNPPIWLEEAINKAMKPSHRTQTKPKKSHYGFLDSLFSTFEKNVDSVINQVDALTINAANLLNDYANEPPPPNNQKRAISPSHSAAMKLTMAPPLFGTSLQTLVTNERRCINANYQPKIGIPSQVLILIDALSRSLDVPGLFRTSVPLAEISQLRQCLENDHGLPDNISPHALAQCLLQWLYELPEPLLGFDLYDAIQSCLEIDNEEHQIRNMALLMEEVPVYNRPTLCQVLKLFQQLVSPENKLKNGVSEVSLDILATPFLLRPHRSGVISGRLIPTEESDRLHITISAAGSCAVSIIIKQQDKVLQYIIRDLELLRDLLKSKCAKILNVQKSSMIYLPQVFDEGKKLYLGEQLANDNHDFQFDSNLRNTFYCLLNLWKSLRVSHIRILRRKRDLVQFSVPQAQQFTIESEDDIKVDSKEKANDEASNTPQPVERVASDDDSIYDNIVNDFSESQIDEKNLKQSIHELMNSHRWKICFPKNDILEDLRNGPGGFLALQCMTLFLTKFGEKAALLVADYSDEKRYSIKSFPDLCLNVFQLILTILKIVSRQSIVTAIMNHKSMAENSSFVPMAIVHKTLNEIAKENSWTLLDEDDCIPDIFTIALLTIEDLWKHWAIEAPTDIFTNCMTGCQVLLEELLEQRPSNMEQMWKLWTEQRVLKQQVVIEAQLNQQHQLQIKKQAEINQAISEKKAAVINKISANSVDSKAIHVIKESDGLWMKSFGTVVSAVYTESDEKSILTADHIQLLEKNFPISLQCSDWKLQYRLLRDGASLDTLIKSASKFDNTLLVIKDAGGAVFGALVQDKWKFGGEKYYGTGTICVFTFHDSQNQQHLREHYFKMYNTTLKNSYYMLTSTDSIAVGGGKGFAIFLDGDLNLGCSGDCDTFDSPSLSSSPEFTCQTCELYSIEPAAYRVGRAPSFDKK